MGVFIKLVENRPPQEYADPSAVDVTFDDVTKGVSQVTYEYDVLPSGALRILRVAKGEAPVVDDLRSRALVPRHGAVERYLGIGGIRNGRNGRDGRGADYRTRSGRGKRARIASMQVSREVGPPKRKRS